MIRPKYPPTRRKTFKLDHLQPLPIDWSNHVNHSASITPTGIKSPPFHFGHKSRLSRCTSLKAENGQQRQQIKSKIVVDGSKRRASFQESIAPGSNKPDQQQRHSLDTPPTWLDQWVTKWLDDQNQILWPNKTRIEDEVALNEEAKPESPSACSPAETTSGGQLNGSSATTSRCETDDRSSIHSTGSQPELYDELITLRRIGNEQKEKIRSLTTQLEQIKGRTSTKQVLLNLEHFFAL